MQVGKRVEGSIQHIPTSLLTEPAPEVVYELHLATTGIPNPNEAARQLIEEIPKKFPSVKVHWIEIEDALLNIQVSSFATFPWAAFLDFLPTLLGLIGITVSLIAVYLVFATTPGWVIGLFLIGVGFIVFAPKIASIIKGP